MSRRTRNRRALDALIALKVRNADKLTEADVDGIAQCLRRKLVCDDLSNVESCIAAGMLPTMCSDGKALMLDDDGNALAELDVYQLGNGSVHTVGHAKATGLCTQMEILGRRFSVGRFGEVLMNTQCMMAGDRVTTAHQGL